MTIPGRSRTRGFALIEALIALVLIAIGLLAVSKLQTMSLIGSGEGRARAEAANLSQQKIEELRNQLQRGDFDALAVLPPTSEEIAGSNAEYTLTWTVTPDINPDLDQLLVQVSTTWDDAQGGKQRLDLNSLVAWDDPAAQARLSMNNSGNLISPTGKAVRGDGDGKVPGGAIQVSENEDKTKIYTDGDKTGKTYLTKPDGTIILVLPPLKDGKAQSFARISGRVVFDDAGSKLIPITKGKVFVRLSSEGECIYDNSATQPIDGVPKTKYFNYTCYVGPGWYGNVGVSTDLAGGKDPAICVGQPGYNLDDPDGTTISPDARRSATRTYRGFHQPDKFVLSAGMASDGRYGTFTDKAGPFDGKPKPSELAGFVVKPAAASDYLRQDFLLTVMSGKETCSGMMSKDVFKYNAGRRVCISPNETGGSNCPEIWPGFDAPGACTIAIEGGVKEQDSTVAAAFKDAPELPIGICHVAVGSDNYECLIDVPKDTLGSGVIVLNNLDFGSKVIGTTEIAVPAVCPDAKTKPIVHSFN